MANSSKEAKRLSIKLLCVCIALATFNASAAESSAQPKLTDLSLEDLLKIEVTSVSKRPQKISDTAAAVFVVTAEDIRRSGATSITDALRMVPGVEVARIDGQATAVTARGFNAGFANKLLVLIDGRTVYSPLFSGTFWDRQDTFLEDIERIEVIRGPGAAIWGSNAVNGVINVITKQAKDTRGTLISALAGPTDRRVGARYGTTLGDSTSVRLFVNNLERNDMAQLDNRDLNGGVWRQNRVGFRSDSNFTDRDTVTVSGEAFNGSSGGEISVLPTSNPAGTQAGFNSDATPQGGHLKSRWSHQLSETSSFALDAYYDVSKRAVPQTSMNDSVTTIDVAGQHNFTLGDRQRIVWGGGFRDIQYKFDGGYQIAINPANGNYNLTNLFLQDEISLMPERLRLTLGAKIEHSSLINRTAVQPDARLLWNITEQQATWISYSRASRLPSIGEKLGSIAVGVAPPGSLAPFPGPGVIRYNGTDQILPESVNSYQAGYRHLFTPSLSFDLALHYNEYKSIIAAGGALGCASIPGFSAIGPYLDCTATFDNAMTARSHGAEAVLDWRALDRWRLQGSYSYLDVDTMHPDRDSNLAISSQASRYAGSSPRHQITLRSLFDLSEKVQTDFAIRYVDRIQHYGVAAYTAFDARIGWQASNNLDLSLIGRNLFDSYHQEFGTELYFPAAQVRRSVFLRAQYRF